MAIARVNEIHVGLRSSINYVLNPEKTEAFLLVQGFKSNPLTANKEFRKLMSLNLIERKGTGRATYYVLVHI
jgi:hypothetical protein